MRLLSYCQSPRWAGSLLLMVFCQPGLLGQGSGALTIGQIDSATAKRGGSFIEKIPLHLKTGFHCNSNTPADEYLIPLKLTWTPGPAQADAVVYPKPQLENYAFSPKPVSVYSGTFVLETKFKVPADAKPGMAMINGKLRYQACNERECLPPKTLDVQIPIDIE